MGYFYCINYNCSNMFKGCFNFDQPITIGSNVEDCSYMFLACNSLDSDVKIGKNVADLSYMFCRCDNFNSNVIIGIDHDMDMGSTGIPTRNMFEECSNLDKSINFSNNVVYNHRYTFRGCRNLNKPIHLGSNVCFLDHVFDGCSNFNSPITFGWTSDTSWDFTRNFSYIFEFCDNYSQAVYLPSRVVHCDYTLAWCNNFNNYVDFNGPKSTLESLSGFFNRCNKYNYSDIQLSSFPVLNKLYSFLQFCGNFNKNIYLNWSVVENISYILADATSFNCFGSFKSGLASATNLKNCSWAFYNTPMNFGNVFENTVISNSVEDCAGMFHSCSNIYSSGDFVFGTNVTNLCAAFQDTKMIGDIFIYQNDRCNVYGMLYNCPNLYIVNVFCHNLAIINKTSASESLTGYPMTWEYESTGTYYNSAYGIRISNQF